ncbi:MAG: serine--tRNA ligase [Rickettsiales bacterium]|jgi:seryl-tRNA synthetase|nr:serine--tRNA ligase [Rickettsiales bacterium]
MHDIKWIRENTEEFDIALKKRGIDPISQEILVLDESKRKLVTLIQKLQHAKKEKAALIAKHGNVHTPELVTLKRDASHIKDKLSELESKLHSEVELEKLLSTLPNIPSDEVPVGENEDSNIEIRKWGEIPKFSFTPKAHCDLGETMGTIDFVQSAKISGSRFVTLKDGLAKLERALVNFMLDLNTTKFNYTEISPPLLVRDSAMYNAGQLPKFAEDSFLTTDGHRLIPTSEVSLVNLVSDHIINAESLPLRFTAFTPCFRSEAGAAGKDTKGMIRLHQFSKVELVSITTPEESEAEHERITSIAEEMLKLLGLPYRVMLLCTGDMGFTSKKTYDLEVWLPSQNKYREISSCSNCGDFQARRLKARYVANASSREKNLVHTLNGSALAVGRTIVAILENYQQKDGSIQIPEILIPYMHGVKTLK